jgi:hypothetical protein
MILMVIMMLELTKQLHNAFVKQICYAGAAARETVIDTPCKGQSHASRNIYLAHLRLYQAKVRSLLLSSVLPSSANTCGRQRDCWGIRTCCGGEITCKTVDSNDAHRRFC